METRKNVLFGLGLFLATFVHADTVDKTWVSYQNQCDTEWRQALNGKKRHIGRAVCDCMADLLVNHDKAEPNLDKKSLDFKHFYEQTKQLCMTSGVLSNTIERSVFDRVYDSDTIKSLCDASWVGLLGFVTTDSPQFNVTQICQCARSELSNAVNHFDALTPQNLRDQSLAMVQKCDSRSQLNAEQFSNLTKPKAIPAPKQSLGHFSLEIKDAKKPSYKDIAQFLRDDGRLQDIVDAMNQSIKLPRNIKIIATETGDDGFYYSAEKNTIYLDYGMMNEIVTLFDDHHQSESDENRRHYFNNVVRFFLYHELGHALIDQYNLPVLGEEEDAADALGAIISMEYLPKGYHVLVDTADCFSLWDKYIDTTDESSYWDEHSLDKQRYYRLLCFAYGKDPAHVNSKLKHYYKNGLNEFIKERADYCADEYDTTYEAWMSLISPYLLKANKTQTLPQEEKPH